MKCVGEIIGFAMLVAVLGSMAACSPELQVSESELTSVRKMDVGRLLSVYKSPTCGCCGDWVQHVEDAGFITEVHHPEDLNRLKVDNRIAPVHQSCHTAISKEGYIFEGHIPAKYVYQFLEHPPADAIGLSVPAMPLGSPGMEIDDRFSPYQVLLLKKDGSSEVFARVEDQEEQYQ